MVFNHILQLCNTIKDTAMTIHSNLDNVIHYTVPEEDYGQAIEGFGAVVGKTKEGYRLIVADTAVWVSDDKQILFEHYYIDRDDNRVVLTDEEVVRIVTNITTDSTEVTLESIEKELFPTLRIKST